jgi:hypothetical protein
MHTVTDIFVKRHLTYLVTLENPLEELDKFDSLYDHIFFYLTSVIEMPETEAHRIVNDFRCHSERSEALL